MGMVKVSCMLLSNLTHVSVGAIKLLQVDIKQHARPCRAVAADLLGVTRVGLDGQGVPHRSIRVHILHPGEPVHDPRGAGCAAGGGKGGHLSHHVVPLFAGHHPPPRRRACPQELLIHCVCSPVPDWSESEHHQSDRGAVGRAGDTVRCQQTGHALLLVCKRGRQGVKNDPGDQVLPHPDASDAELPLPARAGHAASKEGVPDYLGHAHGMEGEHQPRGGGQDY